MDRALRLIPTTTATLAKSVWKPGEVYYDSNKNTLRLMTGHVRGGIPLATEAWVNTTLQSVVAPDLSAYATTTYVDNSIDAIVIPPIPTNVSAFTNDAGYITTIPAITSLSNLDGIGFKTGVVVTEFSTDPTLSGNATDVVPTESAVKGYVDEAMQNVPSSYVLPTASTTVLGGVKVDGTTITIDGSGVITSAGGGGGTAYDQSLNTTDSVTFVSVTAETLTSVGIGTPTFASGADINFNANSGLGQLNVTGDIVLLQGGSIIGGPVYAGNTGALTISNSTGALNIDGAVALNGPSITIGDASGDSLTVNAATWTVNNSPTVSGTMTFSGTVAMTGTFAHVSWSLTQAVSSNYLFTGPGFTGAVADPVLYLYRGFTYRFDNTTLAGAHPFAIRVSNGGAAYTSGVTGSQTGVQYFTVPMDAPSTLYYQCTIHAIMGNTINIV